jgi:biopolymer transport protein ExbB
MGSNLGQLFLHGGWVMWPLLFFSIVTWAVVLERIFVFMTLRPRLARLAENLVRTLRAGDSNAAKQMCLTEQPRIAEVFMGTLEGRGSRELAERVTERNRVRLMGVLKKNLWVLGTIASASPFIGLLGTVVGIVRAFNDMKEKGAGGFSVVAGGISEALIATAAGLVVAIVAVLAYNIFLTAANQTLVGVKLTLEELLDFSYEKSAARTNE